MTRLDSFQLWIQETKVKNVAKKLNIKYITVWHWFKRNRSPKPTTALKIVKMSKLSWEDIYKPYALKKLKNK